MHISPHNAAPPTVAPPEVPESVRSLWRFKPGITYLNHGSFGACPTPVLEAAADWDRRLAQQPCEFFQRDSPALMEAARARLGEFLGCPADDLIEVPNATVGGNIVAHDWVASGRLRPGDRVLTTDHEYGAMLRMWRTLAPRAGAAVDVAELPWPVSSPDEVVEAIFARVTERTRLLAVSHITSPTALVLPIERIVARAHQLGVPVLVDGAHAPGMVPLRLAELAADWYTGNCHKWLCASVGAGFLYRHRGAATPGPLIVSWGERPGRGAEPALWQAEFEWTGTRAYSAFLAVPTAIDLLRGVVTLERWFAHSRALIAYARGVLGELPGLRPVGPTEMCGAMVSFELPPGDRAELQNALFHRFAIEVPVLAFNGRRLLRVSAAIYNTAADVDRLAAALRELLDDRRPGLPPSRVADQPRTSERG